MPEYQITPDAWQADSEALRAEVARLTRERDEARRLARRAKREMKRAEEDHRAEVEAQVVRLEAQSEVHRRQTLYWQERARVMESGRQVAIRTQIELRQEATDERGAALDLIEQVKIRDAKIQAVRDEAPTIPADDNDREWLIMSDLEAGGLFAWQDVLNILDASPD